MASSPSMDIDVVVDLHTNAATAAAAAQALLNENSSNASSDAGLNVKFPILYTSSSSDTDDDYLTTLRSREPGASTASVSSVAVAAAATVSGAVVESVRTASPPPNCAICLGRCKNKCFTDSCVHQFCFKCLCEWSKVKAECPLCKQAFRSIIHNVKAIDQYEEYLVQQPVVQIPHSPLEVTYQGPLNRGIIVNSSRGFYNFSMRSWPQAASHMGSRSGPITIRNYLPDNDLSGSSIPSASVAVNAAVESLPMRRSELLNLYRQELPDEVSSSMSVSQLWRRYIYDRKLYALPVSDITGRYRESSARFYRNNPGQRIRLIPFANRDIICLLRDTTHDVSTVLETLNEGLEVSNILSRSFRRRLQPYLGERTVHFIHELSNFARSPYDMIGYDRAVQYAPQAISEDHVIEFSTSSDEETNSNGGQAENNNSSSINLTANEATAIRRAARRNAQQAASSTARNRTAGTSEFRVQSRSSAQAAGMHSPMSLLSFTITTTSEGSEAPGVSVAVSAGSRGHAQVAAINLSTHNRAHNEVVIDLDDTVELNGSSSSGNGGDTASSVPVNNNNSIANVNTNNEATTTAAAAGNAETHMPEPQPGTPQIVASIALSTSSSDECEFVLERKPPHLRTPEMVSLNSESDSDVVFVDETKPIMAEATYSTSENEAQTTLNNLIAAQNDEEKPSTSSGLRTRAARQLVAASKKTNSSSIQRRECSPSNRKRRMRTRRHNTTSLERQHSTDETTSDEHDDLDDDDSEYNGRQRSRGRATARKRGARARKSNSSRRIRKKRKRTTQLKEETIEEPDQNSNTTVTNEPKTKRRRVSTRSVSKGSKSNNQRYNSSNKHTSTSEDESSTAEDEKVNLKALQLRLKRSLSDVEEQDYDYTPPREQEAADTMNRMPESNNTNDNVEDNVECQLTHDDFSMFPRKLIADISSPTSPTERPTTSAAAALAAAAAAAEVVASISTLNEYKRRASFEASNASFPTSCVASNSETQQAQEEETRAPFHLGSMSPTSLSSTSMQPFKAIDDTSKTHAIDYVYNSKSPISSLGSNSSIDSYQLPSTSQQRHVQNYSPCSVKATTTTTTITSNVNFNESDTSNSATTSSSSSTSAWSGSEDERDSYDKQS